MKFLGIPLDQKLGRALARHFAALVVIMVGIWFVVHGALAPWSATEAHPINWLQVVGGTLLLALGASVYRDASK